MIVINETHLREGQSSIFKNPIIDLRKKVGYAERARGGLMILAEEAHRAETQILFQDPDNNYAIIRYRELVIATAYLAPSLPPCSRDNHRLSLHRCIAHHTNKNL